VTLTEVVLRGCGLHTGEPCAVTLRAEPGPVTFGYAGHAARAGELEVLAGERATWVRDRRGRFELRTVEHLCAALAALALYEGIAIEVDGGAELPLLDGGARDWMCALRSLGVRAARPRLVVAERGRIALGDSVYEFEPPAPNAPAGRRVEAQLVFDAPYLVTEASWGGDADDFERRVAPARTFGFARELAWMTERGLAAGADAESVVLVGESDLLSAGRPAENDEPARHKLLDLVGDFYLYGGPPVGTVVAHRPGHAATHAVVERALAGGILVPAE
jgi:UDP-3-O-[3-hydroxymyristoyl] N-acetylglucosamine deacetylase